MPATKLIGEPSRLSQNVGQYKYGGFFSKKQIIKKESSSLSKSIFVIYLAFN